MSAFFIKHVVEPIGQRLRMLLVRVLERMLKALAANPSEAEARYAEQLALLKTTLEHVSQGIMMVAPDGSVPVINRRAIELLELPEELVASGADSKAIVQWQWDRGD